MLSIEFTIISILDKEWHSIYKKSHSLFQAEDQRSIKTILSYPEIDLRKK